MPAGCQLPPLVDHQFDLVLAVEITEGRPLIVDQGLHPVGLGKLLVPLVLAEFERVAGGAAIIMRRPAVDRARWPSSHLAKKRRVQSMLLPSGPAAIR